MRDPKCVQVNIRMSKAQRARLIRDAKSVDMSVNAYVLDALHLLQLPSRKARKGKAA